MKQLIFLLIPCLLSPLASAKTLNEATEVSLQCNLTYQEGQSAERNVPLSMVTGYVGDGVSNVVSNIHGGLNVRTERQGVYNYFAHSTSGTNCDATIPHMGRFDFFTGITNVVRSSDQPFSYPRDYVGDAIYASVVNSDGTLLQINEKNPELNKTYETHTYYRSTVRSTNGYSQDRVIKVTLTCVLTDRAAESFNTSYPNVQTEEEGEGENQSANP